MKMPNETNRPLLARVADPATLLAAWQRIRAKGAVGGIDGISVEEFATEADAHLETLRRELLEDRYVPEPLQQVSIPKGPDAADRRILGLPTVRDKVTQEAVRSVLEPILDRGFLDCSYGYRPGKGPVKAIGRVTHYLGLLKRRWIVCADIDDFFGSIDHRELISRLRGAVQDEAVLRLVQMWLKMGMIDGRGRWHDVCTGVHQGGVISPLLSNFYFHPFDQSMTGKAYGLVRYADDFVVLCKDRSEAEGALVHLTDFLDERLHLRLNPNPRPIATLEDGFAFLGIFFQGDRRLIDEAKLRKIQIRIQRLARREPPDFAGSLRDLNEAVAGWRRFYAQVLPAAELQKIERLAFDGAEVLVAAAFRSKTFKNLGDAESALQHLEMLAARDSNQRRNIIASLARRGRDMAVRPPQPAQPQSGRPSVAARVRGRKRRYHRQLAQISELVLNTPGCFLGKVQQRLVVRQNRRNVCEVPSFRLTGITVANHGIALSADVISHCAEHDIPVMFISPQGKVVAVLSAPESPRGAAGLTQLQALSQGKPALELAKRFAEGKIRNQANLMKYCHKYRKHVDAGLSQELGRYLQGIVALLEELRRIRFTGDYEPCRGHVFSVEGRAATLYWDLFGRLLNKRVEFDGRERKGATDLVNSLLNYGYAVLQSRVHLATLRAGLEPQISFLHALQKGKPTLTYDLMEEFRPQVVDRTLLAMASRREPLQLDDQGLLTEATRRLLISRIHDRLATLIKFRSAERKLDEIITDQARLLVAHLKGERKYRPFIGKW